MKKYELTNITKDYRGVTLHQIKALQDFGNVKAGDLGGWIEKEDNLSHGDNCWVYENALVSGYAKVYENALVYDRAKVFGHAEVYGHAMVFGHAEVYGHAMVYDQAEVYGHAMVYDQAEVYGNALVLENAKVYGQSQVYGNAFVYGDARVRQGEYTIVVPNFILSQYSMTPNFPNHIAIGCKLYDLSEIDSVDIEKEMKENNIDLKLKELYMLQMQICKLWLELFIK